MGRGEGGVSSNRIFGIADGLHREQALRLVTSACLRATHRQAATALATILELILGADEKTGNNSMLCLSTSPLECARLYEPRSILSSEAWAVARRVRVPQ